MIRSIAFVAGVWLLSHTIADPPGQRAAVHPAGALFATSADCMACHNGLTTPSGEDVSIGTAWRATMMANSSRDPYWQASVRREVLDHPRAADAIEDECSVCHMPMSHTSAHAARRPARVFAHLPVTAPADPQSRLAHDGVSCTLCHQIGAERFGTRASFTGGFVIDTATPLERRPLYGPFEVDRGLNRVMHSATGFVPTESAHVQQSELCATCHTLYTTALGPDGSAVGELPEQVPFLEWRHSRYRGERSCQACHMPAVEQPTAMASVLGQPREGMSRHSFTGGNFFMLEMLNRHRADLGVEAPAPELEAAVKSTLRHLRDATARLTIDRAVRDGRRTTIDVSIENLSGHKLPTAYPSRRAWIHLTVRRDDNRVVFESGRVRPDGAVAGNDNDADPARFEPHYREITSADQVQIYESILVDSQNRVTTGLLTAVRYAKDNRLLPQGFDKRTAAADIAVLGAALEDQDFTGGRDRVRYVVDLPDATTEYAVDAELLFQPIGFRWAHNLRSYDAAETRRFVRYFDAMASIATATVAQTSRPLR